MQVSCSWSVLNVHLNSCKIQTIFIPHHDFQLHIFTCPVVTIRNTLHEHVICANNIVTCKSHLKDVDLSPFVNCNIPLNRLQYI